MERTIDDLTIAHLRLLIGAADAGSFTAAASQAGISPAAVSKVVTRVEKRLGVPLFYRTTRQMRMTETGARYVDQCRDALASLDNAGADAMGEQATPKGKLRISIPAAYAYGRLFPYLQIFRERYPEIHLEIQISDRPANLGGGQFDLAIRGYDMADSTMKSRKIENAELIVIGAPVYLMNAPPLKSPNDLGAHQCIQFRLPESGKSAPWSFLKNGKRISFQTSGAIICEEEYLAGAALAKAGAGVYQIYRFIVEDDLAAGRLVEVLPEHGGATRPFYVVHPGGAIPLRLRVFLDFLHDNARHYVPR